MENLRHRLTKLVGQAPPALLAVAFVLALFLIFWTLNFIRTTADRAVTTPVEEEARAKLPKINDSGLKTLAPYLDAHIGKTEREDLPPFSTPAAPTETAGGME